MSHNMNGAKRPGLTVIDSHVHIYECFDLAALLNSAYENFSLEAARHSSAGAFTGMLMLTETAGHDWFSRLSGYAETHQPVTGTEGGTWHFSSTQEDCSLLARSSSGRELIVMAGRQVVTSENLEVLALATRARFLDGAPLAHLLMSINEQDAIPVVPWGAGKWFGERGGTLRSLLESTDRVSFFLGDNGGRPVFWPRPAMFRLGERHGTRVLPGTDPLPLPQEASRCGSFGIVIRRSVSPQQPRAELKRLLEDRTVELIRYGKLEKTVRFLRNQLQLRLLKRETN